MRLIYNTRKTIQCYYTRTFHYTPQVPKRCSKQVHRVNDNDSLTTFKRSLASNLLTERRFQQLLLFSTLELTKIRLHRHICISFYYYLLYFQLYILLYIWLVTRHLGTLSFSPSYCNLSYEFGILPTNTSLFFTFTKKQSNIRNY